MHSGSIAYAGMILVITRHLLSMSFMDFDIKSFEHGDEELANINEANTSFKPVVSEVNALSCEWFKVERTKLQTMFCDFNYDRSDDTKRNEDVDENDENVKKSKDEAKKNDQEAKNEKYNQELRWFCQNLYPKDGDCDHLQNIFKDYWSNYCKNELNPVNNKTDNPDLCSRVRDFFDGYIDVIKEPKKDPSVVPCEEYDGEISIFGNKHCENIGEEAGWLDSFCESLYSRSEEDCEALLEKFQDFGALNCEGPNEPQAIDEQDVCRDAQEIVEIMSKNMMDF